LRIGVILLIAAGLAKAGASAVDLPTPAPPRLTLAQVVRLALRRNPALTEARGAYRQAVGRRREASARRNPTARVDGRATLQGPIPSFQVPNPTTGQAQSITFGRTFTKDAQASATYTTDISGRLRIAGRVAARDAATFRTGINVEVNDLVFSAQDAFLAARRAEELIVVAEEAVAAAKEQLRVAAARVKAGDAPKFDELRAQVQVANLQQDLVAARAEARRSRATLARFLSMNPEDFGELAPVELPPAPAAAADAALLALAPAPDQPLGPLPQTTRQALLEALNARPEVIRSEWNLRLARARVNLERRGTRPELAFTASYFFTPDQTGFFPVQNSWSLVANLSITLWDGGVTKTRVHQARSQLRTAVAAQQRIRDGVEEQVRRAFFTMQEAQERRRATAATSAQAREALRIARVRYSADVAPPVEVTDAEVALTRARTNEINAGYDYLDAVAALNRALGRYTHYAQFAAR